MKTLLLLTALFLAGSFLGAKGDPLLVNGSFQTGDFTGWNPQYAYVGDDLFIQPGYIGPNGAYPGTSDAAGFGTSGSTFDYLSQSFASTVGTQYQLTFALETYGTPNEFLADIGGTISATPLALNTAGGNPNYVSGGAEQDINNTSTDAWKVITIDYTATAPTTEVIFAGLNNNASGVDYLTDVSVSTAPEPSTWALLLGGVGLLAFWRRGTRI
jgi:MYXO-CTERM domain-containing protein